MNSLRLSSCIKTPEIINTKQPFSNFSFIDKHFNISYGPIYRIFSLARIANYKTLVIEEINSVGFSEEEDFELQDLSIPISKQPLIRLSFFKTSFNIYSEIEKQSNDNFIGYAILKKYPKTKGLFVFESVIHPRKMINNYIHINRKYEVKISNKTFYIQGILYCQQNQVTSVCAHVALRTLISTVNKTGDISYSEINKILSKNKIPHLPNSKMDINQICSILNKLNLSYTTMENPSGTESPVPYQSYMYGSIESGLPALLGFYFEDEKTRKMSGHIIPILGHTFNEDTWVPDAEKSYFRIGKDTSSELSKKPFFSNLKSQINCSLFHQA